MKELDSLNVLLRMHEFDTKEALFYLDDKEVDFTIGGLADSVRGKIAWVHGRGEELLDHWIY